METPRPDVSRLIAVAAHADAIRPRELWLNAEVGTLGRAQACDLVVQGPLVSRMHAQIRRIGLRYQLSDLGSANGTFVNGKRLREPHLLSDGDLIGLGAPTGVLSFLDADPTVVSQEQLRFDLAELRFFVGAKAIDLTPLQLKLLRYLYTHAGTVCARDDCARAVWGEDYRPDDEMNGLDRMVTQMRAALRAAAPDTEFIRTRRGIGYELIPWLTPGEP